MSYSKDKKSIFTRVYKRASKSPYQDAGTYLWLGSALVENKLGIEVDYSRYIYLHRHADGSILGISVSKQMLDENPEFENRYIEGELMYAFLLLHLEEICDFCCLFEREFEEVFLLKPLDFFCAFEQHCLKKLSDG